LWYIILMGVQMNQRIKKSSLYGLDVSVFTYEDLVDIFNQSVKKENQITCYGHSLTAIPRFRIYPQIFKISQKFDIMVPDGKGFYILCRLFGIPLKSDMALYEISDMLLKLANEEGYSVLLLGSDAESNKTATANIKEKYSKAKILEGHHGYFSELEESSVVDYLNLMNPEILLIGMSSPKKEEFFARNIGNINAKVVVLIGGVIDIYAGKTKPIPRYIKVLCLTWIYRFLQEPKRLISLFTGGINILFKMVPQMIWSRYFKKNDDFTIAKYVGLNDNVNND